MTKITIGVEKYFDPTITGYAGWMVHSNDDDAAGVYGFDRTQDEALRDFAAKLQAEEVQS